MAETKYKRNRERHVKPTRLLVQLLGSGNYGSNEFQPAENISRYLNKKLSLIRTRYRKLFLLTNSLDNPEKVEKELKMVLTDSEFIKQDELVIRRINEAEGLLIDRMWNYGGTKDGDSNELSSSLYIVSNLKQSLLEMQKIRKEHGDIRKNLQNFNEDYHIIYNAFMKSREISVIRNIAKNSHINTEPVSVYGEVDKESAFSFYNYDESTNKNRFIKTEAEVEHLEKLLNYSEFLLEEYKKATEGVLNADLSTSIDSENIRLSKENVDSCSISDILYLSCGLEKGIIQAADEVCYYRQKLKFAEETVRCAKARKIADLKILEMYKKLLRIKETTVENLINYGLMLDNKLSEIKKYRRVAMTKDDSSDNSLLSDKLENFFRVSSLLSIENSVISQKLSRDLMEEPYLDLKDILKSQIISESNRKSKICKFADLLEIIKNNEESENIHFEDESQIALEIAENPEMILMIIEALKTGKEYEGKNLTSDDILKLNKVLSIVHGIVKEKEKKYKNNSNGNGFQNLENQEMQ